MGVFQALFQQPSRSYSLSTQPVVDEAGVVASAEELSEAEAERAQRRSQYYSAASDMRLRKEWERMLATTDQRTEKQVIVPRAQRPSTAPNSSRYDNLPSIDQLTASSNFTNTNPVSITSAPDSKEAHDEDKDNFYTPVSSTASSPINPTLDLSITHSPSRLTRPNTAPSTMYTPSSATSQSSEDDFTDYSWSVSPGSEDTHITIASSSRHSKHASEPTQFEPLADWSKDIRWLVPPEETSRFPKMPKRAQTIGTYSESSTSSASTTRSKSSRSRRAKTEPIKAPRPKRRMSEIQEETEDHAVDGSLSGGTSSGQSTSISGTPNSEFPQIIPEMPALIPQSSRRSHTETSSTSSLRVVEAPILMPHAEPRTYTSLILPRSIYKPSKGPLKLTAEVDIVTRGMASTTMSTISVTKHAAEALGLSRRLSITRRFPRNSLDTPKHLQEEGSSQVTFSSHTPTPSKVLANQVLLQVCSVVIDSLDLLLVQERSKSPDGYGFIPGRGFLGRIVEIGSTVTDFRRSDWVLGVLDIGKCGALSEFIVVDKRRVHRVMGPSAAMSAEQLTVLAVTGVFAHRAVNTLPGPLKGSRVLVLQGQNMLGALIVQQLVADGAEVTAQINKPEELNSVKSLGVKAVKIGEPLAVIEALEDSCFDAVIDNVGGKDIWETSRRLFGAVGQFTTTVGDSHDAALSRNAHVKSNMRSLKSAFSRRSSGKTISYEWVSPSLEVDQEGNGFRDSLSAVILSAARGKIHPNIPITVPFERSPEILNGGMGGSSMLEGGVAVIRIMQ